MSGDKDPKNKDKTDSDDEEVKPEPKTKMSAEEVTLRSGTMHVSVKTLQQGI